MSDYPGTLVTLEGIDGSGKTTVWNRLQELDLGDDVVFTTEPTDSWTGEIARESTSANIGPWLELGYFCIDHEEHLNETIEPALADGKTVICDRYVDSRAVYQGIQLEAEYEDVDDGSDEVWLLHQDSPVPDLTIVLTLSVSTAADRVTDDDEPDVGLEEVADRYSKLVREEDRAVLVPASGTPELVTTTVVDTIKHHCEGALDE